MAHLKLPGGAVDLVAGPPPRAASGWNRIAYAAAHVVADPMAEADPWVDSVVDWDRTLAFREHLWSLGFGVAEAMDTAQRGMGLGWSDALELIRRTREADLRKKARNALKKTTRTRSQDLQETAWPLGARLYAEDAPRFASRVTVYLATALAEQQKVPIHPLNGLAISPPSNRPSPSSLVSA